VIFTYREIEEQRTPKWCQLVITSSISKFYIDINKFWKTVTPSIPLSRKRKKGIEALNNKLYSVIIELKEERETDSRFGSGVCRFGDHRWWTCGVRNRSKEEESKRESLTIVCVVWERRERKWQVLSFDTFGYISYREKKCNVIFGGCVSYAPSTTATIFFIIFYTPSHRVSWDTNFSILLEIKLISNQHFNVLYYLLLEINKIMEPKHFLKLKNNIK